MRKIICCILIFALCIFTMNLYTQAEDNISNLHSESIQIQEQINDANNKLNEVEEKLSENMQKIQEIDERITKSQSELEKINKKIEDLMQEIEQNEKSLKQIEEQYNNLKQLCQERIIAIYEMPKLQYLDVLLNSTSMTKFISNYYVLKELMEYDKELLTTVENQLRQIENTKNELSEQKKELVEDKQASLKKAQVLANIKTVRNKYIEQLTEEEKKLQADIDEYNTKFAEVEAEIKLLALNSISEDYLGGVMAWPVPGYTTITSTYGMRTHPITGVYKLHTGIDIGGAPVGTSFVAAANGMVTKACYNAAYGNMVIIDHGGGVQTLYAHGDSISVEVGQVVSTGDEVLKVGSTGYSTGPHAHFEIRINGETVNPLDYLLKDMPKNLKQNDTKDVQDSNENNN